METSLNLKPSKSITQYLESKRMYTCARQQKWNHRCGQPVTCAKPCAQKELPPRDEAHFEVQFVRIRRALGILKTTIAKKTKQKGGGWGKGIIIFILSKSPVQIPILRKIGIPWLCLIMKLSSLISISGATVCIYTYNANKQWTIVKYSKRPA